MVNAVEISPAQLRAARAWLGWTQDDLAVRAGISKRSIARYELSRSVPHSTTLIDVQRALESAGIRFLFDGAVASGICFARSFGGSDIRKTDSKWSASNV